VTVERWRFRAGRRLLLAVGTLAVVSCTAPAPPAVLSPERAPAVVAEHEAFLDELQERTFRFFWDRADPATGLVDDRWPTRDFASIAATGFGLTAYPVGVERGWVSREAARRQVLATLRFLWQAPQGPEPAGTAGHRGFFYHFLDPATGERHETVELSTIDTALLLGGALFCRGYFDGDHPEEVEIRRLAGELFARVDWTWAQPNPPAVNHGWKPEIGFLDYDWRGYNESMLLYILALGSPSHPIDETAWDAWTSRYRWARFQGYEYVAFAPLFGHQYSHVWVDFRGIQDAYMRRRGIDYFENSRRATLAQRAWAIENPRGWEGLGPDVWGITACDGPADVELPYRGETREFFTYAGRGVGADFVRDDGTIAPTAAGGSVPFAPEVAIPALLEMRQRWSEHLWGEYGFLDAFNPSFGYDVPVRHGKVVPGEGWFDTDYLGIDQGTLLAMIENHRSGLVWRVMREDADLRRGLERAGFTGGWLEE
jgi:hypothetical protein